MPGYSSWAFLMRRFFRRRPRTNTTSSQPLLTATDAKTVRTLKSTRVFVGATTTSPQLRIKPASPSYNSTTSCGLPSSSCSTVNWPQECAWLRLANWRRQRGQVQRGFGSVPFVGRFRMASRPQRSVASHRLLFRQPVVARKQPAPDLDGHVELRHVLHAGGDHNKSAQQLPLLFIRQRLVVQELLV